MVGIFLLYGAITDRAEESYVSIFSAISKDIVIEQKGDDTLACKNITVSENAVLSLVMGK